MRSNKPPAGWKMQEPGCWVHLTLGTVERDSAGWWYAMPVGKPSIRNVPTMRDAIEHCERAAGEEGKT